jgi:hypothetical protein
VQGVAQQPVFQLRIQLEHLTPTVWRRVLVPGGVRLARLHDIFQAAMGWTNSHLHSFTIGQDCYGMHVEDYPDDELDKTEYTVFVALRGGVRRFHYEYDFGDSWEHEVVVETTTWAPLALKHAVCLDGQKACPPEDVGEPVATRSFWRRSPTRSTRSTTATWSGWATSSTQMPSMSLPPTQPSSGCADYSRLPRSLRAVRTRKFGLR